MSHVYTRPLQQPVKEKCQEIDAGIIELSPKARTNTPLYHRGGIPLHRVCIRHVERWASLNCKKHLIHRIASKGCSRDPVWKPENRQRERAGQQTKITHFSILAHWQTIVLHGAEKEPHPTEARRRSDGPRGRANAHCNIQECGQVARPDWYRNAEASHRHAPTLALPSCHGTTKNSSSKPNSEDRGSPAQYARKPGQANWS